MPGVQVRCFVERWRNRLTRRASQATAAVTGACRGNSRRWSSSRIDKDEDCEAKRWGADGHQRVANLNFNCPQVVRQHTLGVVGYVTFFYLQFLQFTPLSNSERMLFWQSYRYESLCPVYRDTVYISVLGNLLNVFSLCDVLLRCLIVIFIQQ